MLFGKMGAVIRDWDLLAAMGALLKVAGRGDGITRVTLATKDLDIPVLIDHV